MPTETDRIGPWLIERQLGRGGMATVFQCHHENHPDQKRALKVIHEQARTDSLKRFAREAEILFALRHPAVVQVVDMDFTTTPPYLVMELVDGEDLIDRLRRGPIPEGEACRLFRQLAEGLQYAHDLGIRHRDVKPGNIMLGRDGSIRLLDFGIALLEGGTRLTSVGMALGTVRYMPPEILRTDQPDGIRWDVYSTGVVLFEALTGQPAFLPAPGATSNTSWLKVLRDKFLMPPLDPGPSFAEPVRNLIRQATHPDAAQRLTSMAGFVTILGWQSRSSPRPAGAQALAPPLVRQAEPTLIPPLELMHADHEDTIVLDRPLTAPRAKRRPQDSPNTMPLFNSGHQNHQALLANLGLLMVGLASAIIVGWWWLH